MHTLQRLIIFTRFPEPGSTKTRLIPALGEHGAANLQAELTRHLLNNIKYASEKPGFDIEIRFKGGDQEKMRQWLGNHITYVPQANGDLGRKMQTAFDDAFSSGCKKVVLIGSDIPGINRHIIEQAFLALDNSNLVFGPAKDGGYYLVGMNKPRYSIFEDIRWGSGQVLTSTLEAAKGQKICLLPILADIDHPEDLPVWASVEKNSVDYQKRISVIIPALNEVENITDTIARLSGAQNIEIIVSDGGSKDNTVAGATKTGAAVISSKPGRAFQMNAGASMATGDILFFLHGDTLVPNGWDNFIRSAFDNSEAVGGAFLLGIGGNKTGIRIIEFFTNFRSRILSQPYGDQGLFLKKDEFDKIGGFPEWPILEDVKMVSNLKKHGRFVHIHKKVITSGRRWNKLGIVKTTVINQIIMIGYVLGVSPEKLVHLYRRSL
ncbi:MAG: TIGR04283 family arsenosugar biosynthesis glycosyltransferase [Desulfobacterales bacterium]|nr:TIGR04283 family arsenosugar biosynthesis glycosyltransferase [Desulfobacterales bacterium]